MRSIVREYVSENPDADYDSIVKRFGLPRRIAESCVVEMEPSELLDGIKICQKILLCTVAALTLVVAMRLVVLLTAYLGYADDMNGYAIIEVIEIERTLTDEGGQ